MLLEDLFGGAPTLPVGRGMDLRRPEPRQGGGTGKDNTGGRRAEGKGDLPGGHLGRAQGCTARRPS
jgi:hypothetical protein